jgi:chaperone BCS1
VVEDIDCNKAVQDRSKEVGVDPKFSKVSRSRKHSKICRFEFTHSFPIGYLFVLFLQVTLSGLLNAMDGMWSSNGDERIIVFTTNHKERLDPAWLLPGRMDMHINLSFCTFNGFRILASNYLDVQSHPLFEQVEGLLEKVEVTPAAGAEEFFFFFDK